MEKTSIDREKAPKAVVGSAAGSAPGSVVRAAPIAAPKAASRAAPVVVNAAPKAAPGAAARPASRGVLKAGSKTAASAAKTAAKSAAKSAVKSAVKTAAKKTSKNGPAPGEVTIDDLARRSGVTVRNIRAHQSRGLLPAPDVKGRVGYYDERHIARLDLIQQLQAGGFNLTAIQRLVERAQHTGDDIGNLRNLVLTPFADEQSEVITFDDLVEQLGVDVDDRLLKKAIELRIVLPLDGNRYEVPSPTILRAGVQCVELGITLDMLFNVVKAVNVHSRAVADAFTKMVDDGIVRPVEREGLPAESFPRVVAAIEALRPLATDVMIAGFRVNMDEASEDAFGKILNRLAKEDVKLAGVDAKVAKPGKRVADRSRSSSRDSKDGSRPPGAARRSVRHPRG